MWSVAEEANEPWPNAVLSPEDVLYEFDGPLTFTARFGFFRALFHKIGERQGTHFYLASETSEEKVNALKTGMLSVRGDIEADKYWIIKSDGDLKVMSYWTCMDDDLPVKFLPQSGVPLYSYLPQTADSIEQANAFFAMSFKGPELTRGGMPFSLLRNLTNGAYESARRILSPSFLAGARSATYDFKVKPAIGSLILALGEPIINQRIIQQRTLEAPVPFDKVQEYFDEQRDQFLMRWTK